MEFFRIKRDIPFMKHALILNAVSFLTFVAAVFFLVTKGLHFSIEFTGGTVIQVQYAQAADVNRTRHIVEQMGFGEIQVTNFGTSRVTDDPKTAAAAPKVDGMRALDELYPGTKPDEEKSE